MSSPKGREEMAWRSVSDLLNRRDYIDLTNEVPEETALEITEDLPAEPNNKTGVSGRRLYGKHSEAAAKALPPLPPVNEYEENKGPPPVPDDLEETGNTETPAMSRRGSTSTTKPLLADSSASSLAQPASPRQIPAVSRETSVGGDAPEPKRAKTDSEMDGDSVKELRYLLDDANFVYIMEVQCEIDSNRKLKNFLRAPAAYLFQQLRSSEVRYEKLTPAFKKLFDRAKNRAFVTAEAVRKCTEAEEREGWESGRVIGCRWVLTWKDVPPEDRQHAADDATNNDQTPFTPSGDRKSKARIVHLGYQHPDLLKPEFRSSAQIQATISRYLTFALTVQNQWRIEGLDLSTAFLQTEKNQESQRLWTQLTRELRQALGVSDGGLLRILKDSYGSTTAPRGLWRDIDRNLQKLGAHKILGDPCVWIWTQPNPRPLNSMDKHQVIGNMAGHVDDFNRSGNDENPLWIKVKDEINELYRWGTAKTGQYRYVGCDLEVKQGSSNVHIEINQDHYVETLMDLLIDGQRFAQPELTLNKAEIGQCRRAIGALQWLGIQTQPLICARCNLLLSELAQEPKMSLAQEIQRVIDEVRKSPGRLIFKRLPSVQHWQQMVVITMGDQAHNNLPDISFTGGRITFLGGPELLQGDPGPMTMIPWKTWKLRRVAISSDEAEIQAMVESEDNNFRTRLLWSELNGAGVDKDINDLMQHADLAVSSVSGIVATDSKGGFDAVTLQEGPYLGLSNVRAAIQAFQLKQSFNRVKTLVIWLAGDWLLADALTKKSQESLRNL